MPTSVAEGSADVRSEETLFVNRGIGLNPSYIIYCYIYIYIDVQLLVVQCTISLPPWCWTPDRWCRCQVGPEVLIRTG